MNFVFVVIWSAFMGLLKFGIQSVFLYRLEIKSHLNLLLSDFGRLAAKILCHMANHMTLHLPYLELIWLVF